MNRTLFFLAFLYSSSLTANAQQNSPAAQMMQRFSARMDEPVAAEIRFTFSGADRQGRALASFEGLIYRQGSDYAMINDYAEVYACENTKWIYTVDNNEAIILLHDPASVDLAENPLALFSTQLTKEYTLMDKPNSFVQKGQEVVEITLIPVQKSMPYSSILLRINSQTLTPHSVKYNAKDGSWIEAVITQYTPKSQPFSTERFTFSVEKHPEVYVTDLR